MRQFGTQGRQHTGLLFPFGQRLLPGGLLRVPFGAQQAELFLRRLQRLRLRHQFGPIALGGRRGLLGGLVLRQPRRRLLRGAPGLRVVEFIRELPQLCLEVVPFRVVRGAERGESCFQRRAAGSARQL